MARGKGGQENRSFVRKKLEGKEKENALEEGGNAARDLPLSL